MKIVYIVSTLERSGPINFLYSLVSKMSKTNEVLLITLSKEKKYSMYDQFQLLNLKVINLSKNSSRINFSYMIRKLFRLMRDYSPDVIHSNGLRSDILVSFLVRKGFKCTSTLHNFPFEDYPKLYGFIIGYFLSFVHLFFLRRFKYLVACSDYIKSKFSKIGFNNISTIRNGVDTDIFFTLNQTDKYKLKKKLSLPHDKKILVFSGPLIKRKRILQLVKIFNEIIDKTNFYFVILGDGKFKNKLFTKIISNNIKLFGFKNNVHEFLKSSDFYISYSSSEGLPIGAIEALCTGNILILSSIGPHLELKSLFKDQIYLIDGKLNKYRLLNLIKIIEDKKNNNLYNFKSLSSFEMVVAYFKYYEYIKHG